MDSHVHTERLYSGPRTEQHSESTQTNTTNNKYLRHCNSTNSSIFVAKKETPALNKHMKSHSLKEALLKENQKKVRNRSQQFYKNGLKIPPKLPLFKKKTYSANRQYHKDGKPVNRTSNRQIEPETPNFGYNMNHNLKMFSHKHLVNGRYKTRSSQQDIRNQIPNLGLDQYLQEPYINNFSNFRKDLINNKQVRKLPNSLRRFTDSANYPKYIGKNSKIDKSKKLEEILIRTNPNGNNTNPKLVPFNTNLIKNIKHVESKKQIESNEKVNSKKNNASKEGGKAQEEYVNVVRVVINGSSVPIENLQQNHKLKGYLKECGYNSFEENGKKGLRRRSKSARDSECSIQSKEDKPKYFVLVYWIQIPF